jgi:hypothetical protein
LPELLFVAPLPLPLLFVPDVPEVPDVPDVPVVPDVPDVPPGPLDVPPPCWPPPVLCPDDPAAVVPDDPVVVVLVEPLDCER